MVSQTAIEQFSRRVADEFHPERIILFGSYAEGRATAHSDVDLLVVMPDGGDPLRKSGEIRRCIEAPFALDLIVRDPEVLRWRIDQHDWFLRDIITRGKVLYEAPDG